MAMIRLMAMIVGSSGVQSAIGRRLPTAHQCGDDNPRLHYVQLESAYPRGGCSLLSLHGLQVTAPLGVRYT